MILNEMRTSTNTYLWYQHIQELISKYDISVALQIAHPRTTLHNTVYTEDVYRDIESLKLEKGVEMGLPERRIWFPAMKSSSHMLIPILTRDCYLITGVQAMTTCQVCEMECPDWVFHIITECTLPGIKDIRNYLQMQEVDATSPARMYEFIQFAELDDVEQIVRIVKTWLEQAGRATETLML